MHGSTVVDPLTFRTPHDASRQLLDYYAAKVNLARLPWRGSVAASGGVLSAG
jgi:hypothetical protein